MSIFFSLHNCLIVICGHPFQDVDNDSVIIGGYMDPSFEGAVLSFDCPPHYVLMDLTPRHVWGMENGNQTQEKWNAKVLC